MLIWQALIHPSLRSTPSYFCRTASANNAVQWRPSRGCYYAKRSERKTVMSKLQSLPIDVVWVENESRQRRLRDYRAYTHQPPSVPRVSRQCIARIIELPRSDCNSIAVSRQVGCGVRIGLYGILLVSLIGRRTVNGQKRQFISNGNARNKFPSLRGLLKYRTGASRCKRQLKSSTLELKKTIPPAGAVRFKYI